MTKWILASLVALVVGCGAETGYQVSATYGYPGPPSDLVEVQPGVFAIATVNEPLFWYGNAYWSFRNGGWYRSPYRNGRFYYYPYPPTALRTVNPYAHVRGHYQAYRPRGYYDPYYDRYRGRPPYQR